MATRCEVLWTPIYDKYVTWSSDICLYEVQALGNPKAPLIPISGITGAHLLTTNTNYHYVRCLDIRRKPGDNEDIVVACGLSSGKVALSAFVDTLTDTELHLGKDLAPRHQRNCNALAWNPVDYDKLVSGLEKCRSDHSVLLWDVESVTSLTDSCPPRPITEYALSETVNSLAWVNGKVLAAGLTGKSIKILDFRDSVKAVNSTTTKATYGISVDLKNEKYLASYVDHQVMVWDTRKFEKPMLILPHSKHVTKIGWCPTKQNLLGVLHRDTPMLHLYDIHHHAEDVEPSVIDRVLHPGLHNILSFSWHPTEEDRFMTTLSTGQMLDYTVYERVTLNWTSNANLVWTWQNKLKYIDQSGASYSNIDDVSVTMKRRAALGYGLKESIWQNAYMVEDEIHQTVWRWLHTAKDLYDSEVLRVEGSKHPGVHCVLKLDSDNPKSEQVSIAWSEITNRPCTGSAKIFKHAERDKALMVCGWGFARDKETLAKFIDTLETPESFTRAAAVAVFLLNLEAACKILTQASAKIEDAPQLGVIGMALAGFSNDKNSVWHQLCASPQVNKMFDRYLKALFTFLTTDDLASFEEEFLYDDTIWIEDRIGFACQFLPDNRLNEFLTMHTNNFYKEGNLNGLVLAGDTTDGANILQTYVNVTGDVQTVALIAVRAFSKEMLADLGKEWIDSYRNLLDSWKFWHERAKFDIMVSGQRQNDKPPQQVYISCNFCGKSISAYMQGLNSGRGNYARMGGQNKMKMSACPACRKPLPRCAICLMHLGTTTGEQIQMDGDGAKIISFPHWFTWCQTCRHGGHSSHMMRWFRHHPECPVTGCTCRCFSIDEF